MVFISKKLIDGKEHYYLEQSIRTLDGKVKKISLYLKDYLPKKVVNNETYQKLANKVKEKKFHLGLVKKEMRANLSIL